MAGASIGDVVSIMGIGIGPEAIDTLTYAFPGIRYVMVGLGGVLMFYGLPMAARLAAPRAIGRRRINPRKELAKVVLCAAVPVLIMALFLPPPPARGPDDGGASWLAAHPQYLDPLLAGCHAKSAAETYLGWGCAAIRKANDQRSRPPPSSSRSGLLDNALSPMEA